MSDENGMLVENSNVYLSDKITIGFRYEKVNKDAILAQSRVECTSIDKIDKHSSGCGRQL